MLRRNKNANLKFYRFFKKILIVCVLGICSYSLLGVKYDWPFASEIYKFIYPSSSKQVEEDVLLEGTIIAVSDGDSVTFLDEDNKKVKIRLYGIDAPEIKQKYGREAKNYLSERILYKKVKIQEYGLDRYKRLLGVIYLDKSNINEEMIIEGWAWQYHFNKDEKYAQMMKEAQLKKKNLWKDSNPIDPYDWRKMNKKR